MGLDRLLADRQVPGDLPMTAGDQPEYVAFARRERLQRVRRSAWAELVLVSQEQLGAVKKRVSGSTPRTCGPRRPSAR